jgi:hypothetical protein
MSLRYDKNDVKLRTTSSKYQGNGRLADSDDVDKVLDRVYQLIEDVNANAGGGGGFAIKNALVNETVVVPENGMYTVWGDLTIDPTSTLENYGKIAIINGALDDQGVFDNHGTLDLIDVVDQGDNGLNVAGRVAQLGGTLSQPRTSILGTGDSEKLAFGHNLDDNIFEWFRRNDDALKSFTVITDGTNFNTVPGTYYGEGILLGAKGEFIDYSNPYEYSYLDLTKSNIVLRNEGQDIDFNYYNGELYLRKGQLTLNFFNGVTGQGFGGYNLNLEYNDFGQGAFFNDNTPNPIGLQYAGNYHANYTNRTLVDKEYVDNLAGGAITSASNGLTNFSGDVRLGGALTGQTVITGNGHYLELGANYNYLGGLNIFSNNYTLEHNFAGTSGSRFTSGNGYMTMTVGTPNVGLVGSEHATSLSTTATTMRSPHHDFNMTSGSGGTGSAIFLDRLGVGIEYFANYHTGYTNRSLVDKEYVDNAVGGGGFTLTNGNGTTANGSAVDLGGTLTQTTDILGSNNNLNFGTTGLNGRLNALQIEAVTGVQNYVGGTWTNAHSHVPNGTTLTLTDSSSIDAGFYDFSIADFNMVATSAATNEYAQIIADGTELNLKQSNVGNTQSSEVTIQDTLVEITTDQLLLGQGVPGSGTSFSVQDLEISLIKYALPSGFYGNTNRILVDSNVLISSPHHRLDLSSAVNGQAIFSDEYGKGIEYAANYHGTYTNRSLVDKEYVDGFIDGSGTQFGTTNYIPKFTGSTTIGDSVMRQVGSGTIEVLGIAKIGTGPLSVGAGLLVQGQSFYGTYSRTNGPTNVAYGVVGRANSSVTSATLNVGVKGEGDATSGAASCQVIGVVGASCEGGTVINPSAQFTSTGGLFYARRNDSNSGDAVGGEFNCTHASQNVANYGISVLSSNGALGGTNYIGLLKDGSEGIGKVLTCIDANGTATWQTPSGGGFTLANGSGTTANGSAVDLGGTLTSNAIVNGAGSFNVELGSNVASQNLTRFDVNATFNTQRYLGTFPSGDGLVVNRNPGTDSSTITSGTQTSSHSASASQQLFSVGDGTNLTTVTHNAGVYDAISTGTGNNSGRLFLDGASGLAYLSTGAASNKGGQLLLDATNTFTDYNTVKSGLEYAADYSANYTTRSLVDKDYVDTATSSVNTFPQTTEIAPPLGGAYLVLDGDYTIFASTISGNLSVLLPAAASSAGRVIVVKKKDAANTVNVTGNGAELIDANNVYAMTAQYDKVTIQCDGTQWWIIG